MQRFLQESCQEVQEAGSSTGNQDQWYPISSQSSQEPLEFPLWPSGNELDKYPQDMVQSLALLTGLRICVAMSCSIGHRWSSDSMLLWLWCRPAAAAPIRPPAWELPHASGAVLKKKKKKQNKKSLLFDAQGLLYCHLQTPQFMGLHCGSKTPARLQGHTSLSPVQQRSPFLHGGLSLHGFYSNAYRQDLPSPAGSEYLQSH